VTIQATPVRPGTQVRLELPVAMLPTHTMLNLPLTVVNGKSDGPRLWLSAALHGDELNGVEIIRRVLDRIRPKKMRGLLLAVPIVNVFGFINQSRYLPDRRDLNRSFPGNTRGSLASQIAHLFMAEIVGRCTHGVDLHTASPPRINLPQIRADLRDPETRRCAEAFQAPVMLDSAAPKGALREAARARGVTTLLYEAGEPHRWNEDAIAMGTSGVLRLMRALGMIDDPLPDPPHPCLESTANRWIRASQSGLLYLEAALGDRVSRGQTLGRITDPFGENVQKLKAPVDAMVIGHSIIPAVHRGDGVVHLAEF
jgi:predicted deacylase